jgi:uncharacterized protein YecE (DUF72 family)
VLLEQLYRLGVGLESLREVRAVPAGAIIVLRALAATGRGVSMSELRVGTSGWHYAHWKDIFYPPEVKPADWLGFYARAFDTVEINNSFYRLPSRQVFEAWARTAPPGFVFAVKASRYITHRKKLKDPEQSLERLMENAAGLGKKLGVILFQLPPRWNSNPERLQGFIEALPRRHRYAFEFRDPSWLNEDVYRILSLSNCALCIADSHDRPGVRVLTADFSFFRFHGGRLAGKYSRAELKDWASFAREVLDGGRDLYAYFNNDTHGFAVENARLFRRLASKT